VDVTHLKARWIDWGREPKCPANPAYPHGQDIDLTKGAKVACVTPLPYPAMRCGYFVVTCDACSFSAAITTAGRPDDPRSVKVPCKK
jgi:hypothetical protein